jgi:DNA polymerase-3 subunit gamma/tau
MAQETLYSKYRPKTLEEVVGQVSIVTTLKRAADANGFVNAYIFSGSYGCGKTTTARILANLINCENVKDGKQCGECVACKKVPSKSTLDIIELDGATKTSVEDIKSLMASAQYGPQELKQKVFIIDECHQLSSTAISALLKILEEPPAYLTFILCTTELKKLQDKFGTILSRCQKYHFKTISSKDILQRLRHIADSESISIEDDALLGISQMSRGHMRDAIGYLQQIATLANGNNIQAQHIQKYFGTADRKAVLNIIRSMFDNKMALLMDQINDLVMASVDVREIMLEISDALRNIMLLQISGINKDIVDLPEHEIQELIEIGEKVDVQKLSKLSTYFSDLDRDISININERWIMEAKLIHCSHFLCKT